MQDKLLKLFKAFIYFGFGYCLISLSVKLSEHKVETLMSKWDLLASLNDGFLILGVISVLYGSISLIKAIKNPTS